MVLIHAARTIKNAKKAEQFGFKTEGKTDFSAVINYVNDKVEHIRKHENADYFRKQGMDVELGTALFVAKNKVGINGKVHTAKRIVLATGSRPQK